MRKIVNNANFDFTTQMGAEVYKLPSKTSPDEALTVKQILQKHANGLAPDISKEPIYSNNPQFDDMDLEQVSRLEFDERHYLNERLKKQIDKDRSTVKDAASKVTAAKKAAEEQKFKDAVKSGLKEVTDEGKAKGGSEAKRSE